MRFLAVGIPRCKAKITGELLLARRRLDEERSKSDSLARRGTAVAVLAVLVVPLEVCQTPESQRIQFPAHMQTFSAIFFFFCGGSSV